MTTFQRPNFICGKCHKQVDVVIRDNDYMRDAVVYAITCHESRYVISISSVDFLMGFDVEDIIVFADEEELV